MTKFEVVLIATPGFGNFVPIVEFAQRLIDHDPRFSATILIITMPGRPLLDTYIQSRVATSATKIKFVHLPTVDHPVEVGHVWLELPSPIILLNQIQVVLGNPIQLGL